MLKNKKILAVVPLLAFAAYTMTKPKPVNKDRIKGTVYVMPQTFLLNLADGRYAKLSVALELAPGQSDGASAEGGSSSSGEGAGTLPEEALVREIVTNAVTNMNGESLVSTGGRRSVKAQILKQIKDQTDVKVDAVLFPDLTVQ
ncbi:MAG TPA: flagellar basal body-associated FliL family protein [Solirubrobacteraceae bacterium]|nr:flagellar basal body-associated FliL family protein [Solirubrobacteraceae bacterium]